VTATARVAPARRSAYRVVRRVFEEGAYADRAIQAESRELDRRDRSLAMRLAYGTIQRKGTLDRLIEDLAGRPTARLDAPVLASLRLGLYELLYLDGAPDRAVVADAVELSKDGRTGRGGAHGLVNAVLRRAAREGSEHLLAGVGDDRTPEQAAIAHSHPDWIARLWWTQLGAEQARLLMQADNEPGELALRVNELRTGAAELLGTLGVQARVEEELPEALLLDGPLDLHASQAWQDGLVYAQSRAAMLVARALDPQPGERVLDLCAAPGGKSTHLAALMRGEGEVVAVERNPARARELQEVARRLGATIVHARIADATKPVEDPPFDRVLVDPPCSGLGTLQAHPDLRWRMTTEQVAAMSSAQADILDAGAAVVRPGGVLVYSTCTINAAENESQVNSLLERRPDFQMEDLTGRYPSYAHPNMPGALLTLPHRDRTAGFFIARMRRSGS
jgi:16S rRNA (cytosine967-C5)-methyltransferase